MASPPSAEAMGSPANSSERPARKVVFSTCEFHIINPDNSFPFPTLCCTQHASCTHVTYHIALLVTSSKSFSQIVASRCRDLSRPRCRTLSRCRCCTLSRCRCRTSSQVGVATCRKSVSRLVVCRCRNLSHVGVATSRKLVWMDSAECVH